MVDAMILAQWVVNVGCRDARTRIAHLICEMACRYRAAPTGGRVVFNLPMTQMHMAEATGLTPVHVNRMLGELRASGVEVRRGSVYIEDWNWLVRAGDFDPAYLQIESRPEERIRIVQADLAESSRSSLPANGTWRAREPGQQQPGGCAS